MQCFFFGSRKVSYTLLLRFCQNFVSRVLPHKHRVCCMLAFNFALFSNFLHCTPFSSQISCLCNALPSAPVVCCTLLLLVIYVSCSLPHQHRACAVLFPLAPLKFTPFCFPLFYSVCFCYACFAQQAQFLCSDISLAPLEFARLIFCFLLFSL